VSGHEGLSQQVDNPVRLFLPHAFDQGLESGPALTKS
jgi:hypothetical protein